MLCWSQLTRTFTVHMRALLHTLRARVSVPARTAARTHLVGVFNGRSTPTRTVEMALTNDPDEFVGTHALACVLSVRVHTQVRLNRH